jgi:hypothetical protein
MGDPLPKVPVTNVELLKLLVAGDELAEKLVEAAAKPFPQDGLAATKELLLSRVETALTKLNNAKDRLG